MSYWRCKPRLAKLSGVSDLWHCSKRRTGLGERHEEGNYSRIALKISGCPDDKWTVQPHRESRFKPNQTATVRVLGPGPGPILQTTILDLSGNGMRLRTTLPVPCNTPIEIETQHTIAHGSVCRCEAIQDFYELGIQVSTIGSE